MMTQIPKLPGEFGVTELLVEVVFKGQMLRVFKRADHLYEVLCDDEVTHPKCSPDDAIRALGFYLGSYGKQ